MKKKMRISMHLLAIAIIICGIVSFCIISAARRKQTAYTFEQTDALTHDISVVEEYKSPYVGDAGNIANLFYSLPLGNVPMEFQIDSENCTLKVDYSEEVQNIGEEKVQRDLIYDTLAAMAAIDNLSGITYGFSDAEYSFDREQMENIFGSSLSELLEPENWENEVHSRLNTKAFVEQFFEES